MRIHMIGHASIFVETKDSNILVDPVLFSSYLQGTESICPEREVIQNLIPEFDLLIISHWHSDHYNPQSLAALPKNVDVIIPNDRILKECLRRLGYSRIYTVLDFDEVKIGSTSILTTKSENRVPEFGMVFSDPSGVFWNQVDSIASLNTIAVVKSKFSNIDFLLAPWQPMLENQYLINDTISFPYSLYGESLKHLSVISPTAIAPGANGFKKINSASWMNSIVFPVTRERFCQDIKMACPELKNNIFTLDPGDIIQIDNGISKYIQGGSHFINKIQQDDREKLDFYPVNLDSRIVDCNHDNYDIELVKKEIENEFIPDFSKFMVENKYSIFLEYVHWNVIYQLEIIFPNFSMKWSLDFSAKSAQMQVGRNPCANLFTLITASGLYSLMKKYKCYEYLTFSGSHRWFQKIYMATPHGIVRPENKQMIDPIYLMFPYKDIFEVTQYKEIEKWGFSNSLIVNNENTSMLRLGNTLVRIIDNRGKQLNSISKDDTSPIKCLIESNKYMVQ
mgnify:CR=1 FL=1